MVTEVVEHPVRTRVQAQRRADDERQNRRGQAKQHGGSDLFGDHLVDRAFIDDGGAQIALYGIGQIGEILLGQALVEPPLLLKGGLQDRVIVVLPDQRPDEVARRRFDQDECQREDDENGQDTAEYPADDVFFMGRLPSFPWESSMQSCPQRCE